MIPSSPSKRLASWLPFVAAVGVPLTILGLMAVFSFEQSRHEAELRAQRAAEALAEHALRTFRAHDLIISAVDGHVAGWTWEEINASRALHEFFKGLRNDADDINTIFVIGPNGRDGNSSLLFPLAPTNMAGRPFYEELRKEGGLHISDTDVGRVNKQRFFSFTRRRSAPDGAFDGVISVSVNPAYFEKFYQTMVETPNDAVALLRADGYVLVRMPELPASVERPANQASKRLVEAIRERPEAGMLTQYGSLDGVERIVAYRRVGDYPLYVAYALSYDTVWMAWRRNMLAYALVCLSAMGLLIGAAALVRRHNRREVEAANRALHESARRMAAEETNRAKDEFLATLGHELRNPLSSIAASAEILRRAGIEGGTAAGAVQIIGRQVDHLRRLLNDLLDVARSIYGKLALEPQVLAPLDVAASVAATFHGAIRHEVEIAVDGVRAWVRADPTRLRQMIENLVDNAQKAGARHVRMLVTANGEWVELSVADDGVGIPAELLPRLFEPFVQGKQTIDRAAGGLGLGLALCHRLALAHGGSLHAASAGPGKGSTFTIRLPQSPPPVDRPATAAASPKPARTRVLVIEDQKDARESLRMLLELDQHVVETAASGREGVAKFDTFAPDVVVVDIGLPEMNGFEVAHTIRARERGKAARLIALTGYSPSAAARWTGETAFDHHLTKPVAYDELRPLLVRE